MPEPEVVAATVAGAETAGDRRRLLADVGAVTLLGGVLLWLPAMHGGHRPAGVVGTAILALVAAPAAHRGAVGTSRTERWLLSVLGVALLVHPFVTGYRDGIDHALLPYGSVPLIYLTARYATVRWPRLLPVVIPLAGLWIWTRGLPGWLDPPEDLFAAWRVVPWHNPSGILMGALVVYASVMLLAGRSRWLHAPVAALGASGLWLSASRASIALTVLALVVITAVHLRDRSGALWLGGAAASAVLVTGGLLLLSPAYGSDGSAVLEGSGDVVPGVATPFEARGGAAGNARARILHVETALRMFERAPLVGTGLGSYAHEVLDTAEPRMNFTRSAHSEPVEVLGEGGLLVGVPFAALTLAAAFGLAPLVFGRRARAGRSAAAAAAGLVVAHTLFDVDWAYLLVVGFAAIAAGMARAGSRPPAGRAGWAVVPVLALVLPVGLGLTLTIERSVAEAQGRAGWWEADPHVDRAVEALASGRLATARQAALDARSAAPGDPSTAALLDVVALAQEADAGTLFSVATDPGTPLRTVRFAIAALVARDHDRAREARDLLEDRLSRYHEERVVVLVEELEQLFDAEDGQRSSAS